MSKIKLPDRKSLYKDYAARANARGAALSLIQARFEKVLGAMSSRPTIKGRVKDFDSYFKKYIGLLKDGEDKPQINDIIGMRIVCPFLEDLAAAEELLKDNFEVIETEHKGGDHTFREFGYESIHLLITIPEEVTGLLDPLGCETAEIQIRTILQDAWAEVEHELVYKAEFTPFDQPMKRKLAAVNASLVLADIIFQEIRSYQRELNSELGKRRESFFRKIEESTDALLFEGSTGEDGGQTAGLTETGADESSIDELLLKALYAHNRNKFDEAIALYSRILELKPADNMASLIYKHRGMAFFARSHYNEAIADFTAALELDPASYKAAYYLGVVCSVLREYPPAVDAFNRALAINAFQPYCFYRRAQAYYHLEDYPKALADCDAALALEDFEGARKLKGLLLGKLKM